MVEETQTRKYHQSSLLECQPVSRWQTKHSEMSEADLLDNYMQNAGGWAAWTR